MLPNLTPNNSTDFVACTKDSQCLNSGKCDGSTRSCVCAATFFGDHCEITQKQVTDAIQQNKLALQSLKKKVENPEMITDALKKISAVKLMHDKETMMLIMDIVQLIYGASLLPDERLINSAVQTLGNLYNISTAYKNDSDFSTFVEKIREYANAFIDLRIYLYLKYNSFSNFLPYTYESGNIDFKFVKLNENDPILVKQVFDFLDQKFEGILYNSRDGLISSNFNGGIRVNDAFLAALNASSKSEVVIISQRKYNFNIHESVDKVTKIASPVVIIQITRANNQTVEVSSISDPIVVQIPKSQIITSNQVYGCCYWNKTQNKWSTEGMKKINETLSIMLIVKAVF